jgi:hypothetical protein
MRLSICLGLLLAACGGNVLPMKGFDTGDMARETDAAVEVDMGIGDLAMPVDLAAADLSGRDLSGVDMAQLQDIGFTDMVTETNPTGGPVITLISPLPTSDVVGNTLTVTVKVTGSQIQKVTLDLPGDASPTTMSLASGQYSASHDITSLGATGTYTVTATDLQNRVATLTAFFRHDGGPHIKFIQPTAATVTGTLNVQVTVTDDLYPDIDPSTVKMTIAGRQFDLEHSDLGSSSLQILTDLGGGNDMGGPVGFYATIDLNSFTPPLNGAQIITVSATNIKGTSNSVQKPFTVDNAGPIITIDTPTAGQFIGGTVIVTAEIGDTPSGVNPNSVIAVFGGGGPNTSFQIALTLTTGNATQGTYSAQFDARLLIPYDFITPQLSIQAKDTLGNFSEQDEFVTVDNQPPIVSLGALDPISQQPILEYVEQLGPDGVTYECAHGFIAVGSDVPHDGDTVPQVFSLRARVEDQGNHALGGQEVVYVSGVDQTSVILYAIPGVNDSMGNPPVLAVDTDGDGTCDKLNPLLATVQGGSTSSPSTAIKVPLQVITSAGNANFEVLASQPNPEPRDCISVGDPNVTTVPSPLCTGVGLPSDFTYALRYLEDTTPSIWTVPQIVSGQCAGAQFDSANYLPEGPACIVVAAEDATQNQTISAPIRVCIQRTTPHICDSWTPPDCTGVIDTTTGKLKSGQTCTPRTFENVDFNGVLVDADARKLN